MRSALRVTAYSIVLLLASSLGATHGFTPIGNGAKSLGMAGAGAAYAQDSIVGAINPAGMYWVGNRVDGSLGLFTPIRKYSYTSFGGDSVRSNNEYYGIPSLGYNTCIGDRCTLGVSVTANAGMMTNYPRNNPVFGTSRKLGVDFMQVILAPTFAYRISDNHAVGISVLVGAQRIRVQGLEGFAGYSSSADYVTNNGYSYAAGLGVRVGWMGQLFDCLWVGAAFNTKVYMTKFPVYRGLLADEAKLHAPASFTLGVRYALTDEINIVADLHKIYFNDVRPIGNSIQRIFAGIPLGIPAGAGFGWRNLLIYKVGVDWQFADCWTARAGYSGAAKPYATTQIDPNIIAPATPKHHIAVGLTKRLSSDCELDVAYVHSLRNSIVGASQFGLGTVTHTMYQHRLQIQLGKTW